MAESIAGNRKEIERKFKTFKPFKSFKSSERRPAVGARFIAPLDCDRFERRGALFVIFELLAVNPFSRGH